MSDDAPRGLKLSTKLAARSTRTSSSTAVFTFESHLQSVLRVLVSPRLGLMEPYGRKVSVDGPLWPALHSPADRTPRRLLVVAHVHEPTVNILTDRRFQPRKPAWQLKHQTADLETERR